MHRAAAAEKNPRLFRRVKRISPGDRDSVAERDRFELSVPLVERERADFFRFCYLPRRATAMLTRQGVAKLFSKLSKRGTEGSNPVRSATESVSADFPPKAVK
jgi:hypothetical protein